MDATQISPRDVGDGIVVRGPAQPGDESILTDDALRLVATLERRFGAERVRLLGLREDRQARLDRGEMPTFLPETARVRESEWRVAPLPADLQDRRVEITGPTDRKMVINALNSGANVFMADFEDSLAPTWANLIDGQINLRDANAGTIAFIDPASGKGYSIGPSPAVLIVRPRGWHLVEEHLTVDGNPVSGAFFDFGLYLFHNAQTLKEKGSGPYFYLPKMESHLEARLWAQAFAAAEEALGIEHGTIKATVLIETILAAFEMDEILFELRDYIAGLNCGRWDYIFSIIKKFRNRPDFVMPDRAQVTMTVHALHSYSKLLIQTCHRRGAHAMGGMAAQIPIKSDPAANEAALAKVRADKEREAGDGHDGTWVAHPGLVPIAKDVFDAAMPTPNQYDTAPDATVTAEDLLAVPEGQITEDGLRSNLRVGVQYIEAWLGGLGCVPLYNLMEDAATAEISRSQVWQWLRHGAKLGDGRAITETFVRELLDQEMAKLKQVIGADRYDGGHFAEAIAMFMDVATPPEFVEFLTLPAYDRIKTVAR